MTNRILSTGYPNEVHLRSESNQPSRERLSTVNGVKKAYDIY